MGRDRDIVSANALEESTVDVTNLSHEDRALINTGRAMQARDQELEAQKDEAQKDDDALQQSLVAAAALVGSGPLEQVLFDLDLNITSDEYSTQLNRTDEHGDYPLYHIANASYSPLQKLSAIDDLCAAMVKQGPHGVQAANQLRSVTQQASSNVVF